MKQLIFFSILVLITGCSVNKNKYSSNKFEGQNDVSSISERHLLPGIIEISEDSFEVHSSKKNLSINSQELKLTLISAIQKTKQSIEGVSSKKTGFSKKIALKKLNNAEQKINSTYGNDKELQYLYGCCCLLILIGLLWLAFSKSNIKIDFRYLGAILVFLLLTGLLIAMLAKY